MRKALIPAFLLVLAAIVLGSTVFREQVVDAATTPFQQVVVQNTSTNPVPVTQVGTSTTSVSGTVGIDPNNNTVKLDSNGNTVNLDSTDSGHLANIESALGNLKFDSSGNLETTAQSAPPSPVSEPCTVFDTSEYAVKNDEAYHQLCGADFYITDITAAGMDDNLEVTFYLDGNVVLDLEGGSFNGAANYQMDLTHPIHVDDIEARCSNNSTLCEFTLAVLGNSTGN
jgi:hypothetical protein